MDSLGFMHGIVNRAFYKINKTFLQKDFFDTPQVLKLLTWDLNINM